MLAALQAEDTELQFCQMPSPAISKGLGHQRTMGRPVALVRLDR